MTEDAKYSTILAEITNTNGHGVSIDRKAKQLKKFGENSDLDNGVAEQVWQTGGLEVLSTSNDITHISSSSTSDTQTFKIEGHTIDGNGDLTFVVQEITIAGQTKTALTTPLARATRCFNNGGTDMVGTVYVYKNVTVTAGVPASGIAISVAAADQQSLKCATSISKDDYWFITRVSFFVKRSVSATVDFKLQVRQKGKVFRTQVVASLSSSQSALELNFNEEPIVVPPSSDVRVIAQSDTNNTIVDAIMSGPLGTIIS